MVRFILFLCLLVPLVALGNWLLAHPGQLSIQWLGYDIVLPVAIAVLGILLVCILLSSALLLLWQIATWPERRRARRKFRTLSKGLTEVTHAVTALALGDEKAATRALTKAAHALPGEPLPQLLSAQLLQRQGQHEAARQELRTLMKHETTAALAARRLIEQHLEDREWGQALALAEKLREETPDDRWLTLTLIDLYSRRGDTANMLALTEGWKFRSPLSREERHRYAALAYYQIATSDAHVKAKHTALRHAVGYAPEFLPAAVDYATQLLAAGAIRNARKWLRERWLAAPDPLLIPPIIASLANENPQRQSRLLSAFTKGKPNALHEHLQAAHALAIHEPLAAKTALEKALAHEETQPLLVLMAEIEKRLHGDEAANRMLARAMQAPHGHGWICHHCGHGSHGWQLHCHQCDAFDTLRHELPETRITRVEL